MRLVAGLDFGGGAVKACVADIGTGSVLAIGSRPTKVLHPGPARAEFAPDVWWAAASEAMQDAVATAGRPVSEYAAVTATSLRQGYLLLDSVAVLDHGVLNADRRGAGQLDRLRQIAGADQLYQTTGHWSAPQLTLPKLMQEQVSDRDRWARTECVLFVHDWALWKMSGQRVSEPSMASAGQLLDIERRQWARELITSVGIDARLLPPLHDAGEVIGELRDDGLGLPLGLPVLVGGADTQMAAAGVGGLWDAVVSVVAGTTTPLQASTAALPHDPEQHPWVSAHLVPHRWAVETNAGYAGMSLDWLARVTGQSVSELADEASASVPGADGVTAVVAARIWSEETWSHQTPNALIGFEPRHDRAALARAFTEAHAYAIRGNLEDLERAMETTVRQVCLLGGASRSPFFSQLVADVIGRPVSRAAGAYPAGRAFAWLAARAIGQVSAPPAFSGETIEPSSSGAYQEGYARFTAATDAVRREMSGWAA